MRKINKTLQQKWYDFTHPTKLEHYGYHFSNKDLRQFPEGRIVLCAVARLKLSQKRNAIIDKICGRIFNAFNDTMNKLVLDCMKSEIKK